MKRREFISGMAAGASLLTTPAIANDPISSIIKSSKRDTWNDEFDARKGDAKLSSTNIPVFSTQTPGFIQRAISEYRQISAKGGWPVVPATQKLRLGNQSRNVFILRERLVASRDLDPSAGNSDVFDTWVDGAVRRFQARHGLPADGVMGKYTYAAMN